MRSPSAQRIVKTILLPSRIGPERRDDAYPKSYAIEPLLSLLAINLHLFPLPVPIPSFSLRSSLPLILRPNPPPQIRPQARLIHGPNNAPTSIALLNNISILILLNDRRFRINPLLLLNAEQDGLAVVEEELGAGLFVVPDPDVFGVVEGRVGEEVVRGDLDFGCEVEVDWGWLDGVRGGEGRGKGWERGRWSNGGTYVLYHHNRRF
jgi:hypothetical protein